METIEQSVKFAKGGLYLELKQLVNDYLKSNNIEKTGNDVLYSKAFIIGVAFIATYLGILFFQTTMLYKILLYGFLGLVSALVGFNIMHDAAHGAFSKNKLLNKILSHTADILGGSKLFWNSKHNVVHHTYTNIIDHEEDFEIPFVRIDMRDDIKDYHKYQHLYAFVLYIFTSLSTFVGDFKKLYKMKVSNTTITLKSGELATFWLFKILYIIMYLVLPIYLNGFIIGILGFLFMHFVFGFTMAIVFQLAHLVDTTEFVEDTPPVTIVEDEWMVHQLKTTSDFARRNKLISWLLGGLNFQVEHHLFTNISHIHYPQISKIVENWCNKNKLPYNKKATFMKALSGHKKFLYNKGHYY